MKKRNLKSLNLNKKSISLLYVKAGAQQGGTSDGAQDDTSNTGTHKTADVNDCPDNTLINGICSLGYCPLSWGADPVCDFR